MARQPGSMAQRKGHYDRRAISCSTAVDDVWSAGCVGLYRAGGGSAVQQYDDVKIGYGNNGDGDLLDAGDDVPPSTRAPMESRIRSARNRYGVPKFMRRVSQSRNSQHE